MYNKKKRILIALGIILSIMLLLIGIYCLRYAREKSIACAVKEKEYCVGGEVVGIKLLASGVLVMGVEREELPLQIGDIILEVNGSKIETDAELEEYASLGKPIELTVLRNKEKLKFSVEPKLNESNSAYRIGLWVKDSSAGVGTVTFYEKDTGRFAALGHAITETANQYILPITTGGITSTEIYMIKKGVAKIPGELKGMITNDTIGQIYCNTQNGIFGQVEDKKLYASNEVIELGKKEDIELKEAYIYATLDDNEKKKYKIEIEKVYLNSEGNKNIAIKIIDEELTAKTGGIVQGMSGAPIIQDGKLIGAITHVFLDDPQRGYGAFIENMIEDMNSL